MSCTPCTLGIELSTDSIQGVTQYGFICTCNTLGLFMQTPQSINNQMYIATPCIHRDNAMRNKDDKEVHSCGNTSTFSTAVFYVTSDISIFRIELSLQ